MNINHDGAPHYPLISLGISSWYPSIITARIGFYLFVSIYSAHTLGTLHLTRQSKRYHWLWRVKHGQANYLAVSIAAGFYLLNFPFRSRLHVSSFNAKSGILRIRLNLPEFFLQTSSVGGRLGEFLSRHHRRCDRGCKGTQGLESLDYVAEHSVNIHFNGRSPLGRILNICTKTQKK